MAEQLICNQQVAGSIPISSSEVTMASAHILTKRSVRTNGRVRRRIGLVSEGFPSGQREQTVNLSPLASKVRILPPPPSTTGLLEILDKQMNGAMNDAIQRGSSSVGRAPAFQAGRRGFEPRLPLSGQAASQVLQHVLEGIRKKNH